AASSANRRSHSRAPRDLRTRRKTVRRRLACREYKTACAGARADLLPPRAPRLRARMVRSPTLLRDPLGDLGPSAPQRLLVDDPLLHQETPQRLDSLLEITEPVVELRSHFFACASDLVGAHQLCTLGAERVADDDGQLLPRLRLRNLGIDWPTIEAAKIV